MQVDNACREVAVLLRTRARTRESLRCLGYEIKSKVLIYNRKRTIKSEHGEPYLQGHALGLVPQQEQAWSSTISSAVLHCKRVKDPSLTRHTHYGSMRTAYSVCLYGLTVGATINKSLESGFSVADAQGGTGTDLFAGSNGRGGKLPRRKWFATAPPCERSR